MDFSKELKRAVNDFTKHKSVKVTFLNGDVVEGRIKDFSQQNDYDIVLVRFSKKPGEDHYVNLDFKKIEEVEINYYTGESENFK